MPELRTYKILAVVTSLILFLSACGPSQPQDAAISTAVAQTVQAQQSPQSAPGTASPAPNLTGTPPAPTLLVATASQNLPTPSASMAAVQACTVSAAYAGETIPDGTIVQPGSTFTKIWKIQNTGTCYWDAGWQLIFSSGDLMDGLTAYSLPQPAGPGQTVEVPIILRAPVDGGTYKGEWMLRTPWGITFGVGQYSVPLVVSIVTGSGTPENKKTETVFDVTAVTYKVDRRCAPANTFYSITAYITTNGPLNVTFMTYQSDGHLEKNFQMKFTEATTHSFEWEWSQHKDSAPNPRWAQVIITQPNYKEFERVVLPDLCTFNE